MVRKIGLWIDFKKAVIFSLSNEGAEIRRIFLDLEENTLNSGGVRKAGADEDLLTGRSADYFNEVVSFIQNADSIFIFGPGEAKRELKNRLKINNLYHKVVGFETADRMTDNQIVAKVRQRFLT
jgi:hypothetical protein